jgi:hypothetical protein
MQLDAARAHVFDVCLGRFVPVFKRAFLFRLAPEDFVVPVRIERRVDIDQIDAAVWQLAELFEIIAAVNDARIDERRGFGWHTGNYPTREGRVNEESTCVQRFDEQWQPGPFDTPSFLCYSSINAEDGCDPVVSRAGDGGDTAPLAGCVLHSLECAEPEGLQNGLLRKQDLLRRLGEKQRACITAIRAKRRHKTPGDWRAGDAAGCFFRSVNSTRADNSGGVACPNVCAVASGGELHPSHLIQRA